MSWQHEKTLGAVLLQTVRAHPDAPAVMDLHSQYSYRQLDALTDRIAAGMLSRGVRKGSHVGVCLGDGPVTLFCFYALWKIGAIVIPLCATFTLPELEHCVDAADIEYLLIREDLCPPQQADFPAPEGVKLVPLPSADPLETLCAGAGTVPPEALEAAKAAVRAGDLDTFLFTSGTTGASKPVMTTHLARVTTMLAQAEAIEATAQDRFCSVLPLHHCFSLTATVLAAMAVGACVCFPADRHGHTILKTVEALSCTVLTAVPTLFSALLRRKGEADYDLSSLRIGLIGGSTYPPMFYCTVCDSLQLLLLPSLGQTEATAGITASSPRDSVISRMRTVGRFFPHLEGCIQSDDGKILPNGSLGEICIRGCGVMEGYYKLPQETAKVIDGDGWLHTGDLGSLDDDGYVYYAGRKKELIIRGGENIAPAELEQLLLADPRIAQAKVVGVPDSHFIEEVCACIIPSAPLSPEEVCQLLRGQVAYFKIPRYVLFFQEFPLTPTGKIDLSSLRRQAREALHLSDEGPTQHEVVS